MASVGVADNNASREIAIHAVWLLFCMSSLMAPSCSSSDAFASGAADAVADADAAIFLLFSMLERYGTVVYWRWW